MSDQPTLEPRPAGRTPISALADGDGVDAAFAVRNRRLRGFKNKPGEFLELELGDGGGTVKAIAWEDAEQLFGISAPGTVVWARGRFEDGGRYPPCLKLDELRVAQPHEYDAAELCGGPPVPHEHLETDLRELIATVQNPQLRALLDRFFAPDSRHWPRFREAPAAKVYHEAYVGGLLAHTLSVAQSVSAAAAFFPGVDRDVAVTGALLHDIGKTQAYNDDPLAFDLTDAGRLQGEIPLGYYMVRREIEALEGFDPALGQAVLHIILSHHGSLEHGSPVAPCTREAVLVHAIDNLGGKLGSFDRLERELPDGAAWSGWDRAVGGAAYFGRRAA